MQRARQRGDGSGERYLRTYAQLPGQPSFGVDPAMEALKRIQRLSWKQAVCKLQRIGQHCRGGAESNDPNRSGRGEQPQRQSEACAGIQGDDREIQHDVSVQSQASIVRAFPDCD